MLLHLVVTPPILTGLPKASEEIDLQPPDVCGDGAWLHHEEPRGLHPSGLDRLDFFVSHERLELAEVDADQGGDHGLVIDHAWLVHTRSAAWGPQLF